VDVRIIAATNKDLKKAIKEGTFRQDLYYRLNVIPVHVPPLRERREDIKYLTYHFIEKFNKIYGKQIREISPEAMRILEGYDYPGNIRELENLIERVIVLSKKDTIGVEDLPENVRNYVGDSFSDEIDFSKGFNKLVEDFEKNLIIKALEKNKFNQVQTAKMLNMNRSTLISKLKKYQIS
jgi:transcriptional regulator with PAS, ATPase and Fis domain